MATVICGVGAALPGDELTNSQLGARWGVEPEWISKRTGVQTRRIAATETSTEDLAVRACQAAMTSAGHQRVQALVMATSTSDLQSPANSPGVASRLGMTGIPALDLSAGCSGFVYGLSVAGGFITSGAADSVMVVGAERVSTIVDPEDRGTTSLFGDGAGAVVLRRGAPDEAGALGPIVLGSDGEHNDLIEVPHGGYMEMDGGGVFRHAVRRMCEASLAAVAAAGWQIGDVQRLVAHQANSRITSFVGKRLGLGPHSELTNIATVGNTGAASIPLLLTQAARAGSLSAGHRVLMTAFGAGLTWGATTVVWPDLEPSMQS